MKLQTINCYVYRDILCNSTLGFALLAVISPLLLIITCNQAFVSLLLERVTFLCPCNISWQRKVTKRKDIPTSLPFGSPRHSALPTGRPDSPSGLDRTKFDVPVEFSLPKLNASANFTGELFPPVKLAETCPGPAEADTFTGNALGAIA